ncbi:hypothetical protein [Massilia consociata]|uniref:Lipoprotein n=1 Tax=Massilia consociata TaxID=760117 RepID=A0ABV6FK72_9BURK
MRSLIRLIALVCLSLCLQACGGSTSVALYVEWGSCDFDRDRWGRADRIARGCMMPSFLDRYQPVGMSAVELKLWLGEPTTYADLEHPAYLVAQLGANGRPGREQFLVFRLDWLTGRVVGVELLPVY